MRNDEGKGQICGHCTNYDVGWCALEDGKRLPKTRDTKACKEFSSMPPSVPREDGLTSPYGHLHIYLTGPEGQVTGKGINEFAHRVAEKLGGTLRAGSYEVGDDYNVRHDYGFTTEKDRDKWLSSVRSCVEYLQTKDKCRLREGTTEYFPHSIYVM